MKIRFTKKNIEWAIYILLICALVVYGVAINPDAAAGLIQSVTQAFSILFNTNTP